MKKAPLSVLSLALRPVLPEMSFFCREQIQSPVFILVLYDLKQARSDFFQQRTALFGSAEY
ncbi:MAG TPA: hypothetical protein PLQ42_02380 [Candidatus Hydrogenedentes bacterium]|jgi:hypothetical protein|nr:hypothetical protein [Candidatus Hydrogenedentota bacterium]HOM49199.1 hypothetical protein [Candidatus Hydrogenedentota bacterium]HOR49906.1 hypothetical protein [Candidatus Hydrogenedentota bacterium]HPK23921.1 hypothetical protein [Candidatus Hydrogenedentota bacterium]